MFAANAAAEHANTAVAAASWATVKSAEAEAIQEWSRNDPEAIQEWSRNSPEAIQEQSRSSLEAVLLLLFSLICIACMLTLTTYTRRRAIWQDGIASVQSQVPSSFPSWSSQDSGATPSHRCVFA